MKYFISHKGMEKKIIEVKVRSRAEIRNDD